MLRLTMLSRGVVSGLLALACAGGVSATGANGAAPSRNTAVSPPSLTLAHGVALQAGDQAQVIGANAPVRINVVLKMRQQAELEQVAGLVRSRVRQPLTDSELAARYLPEHADALRVSNFLRAHGFSQIYVSKDNMIVSASGTAANVQSAFQTRLYSLHRGDKAGVANADAVQIPSSLAGVISAVHGLRSFQERGVSGAKVAAMIEGHAYAKNKGVPGTQSTAGTVACQQCVHAPTDFPSLYGASNLAPASGQTVAVIGVGDQRNTTYLYQTWASAYGFSNIPLKVSYPTGYTAGDYEAQTEAVLDVDAVATMSGGLKEIDFYSAPSTDLGDELAAVTAAINDNHSTISLSYAATCDADIGQDLRSSWDQELSVAVAKGFTVFAITQDYGGKPGCSGGESSTGFPGSSPYVVSVGASTVYNSANSYSAYDHETLWQGSESGPAATEQRPHYQDGRRHARHAGFRHGWRPQYRALDHHRWLRQHRHLPDAMGSVRWYQPCRTAVGGHLCQAVAERYSAVLLAKNFLRHRRRSSERNPR
ncbi:S53 family peptidase [Dyella silvatica]|uniref:S53 family peptidase n=1 Tax=Dyella silvatica TaxID=2992128 RepID=UPI00225760DC|nr:protease pro-enzyme activation domain-containing protein [Dyella silvatica]